MLTQVFNITFILPTLSSYECTYVVTVYPHCVIYHLQLTKLHDDVIRVF